MFHNLEDLDLDVTVEDLKCLLEIESSIPVSEQVLFFKNKEMSDEFQKLTHYGVSNNDMITLTQKSIVLQPTARNVNSNDQNLLNDFF